MPTAILIGFEYKFNPLPGALIDLYHAFTWCRSFDCDIHILTDITYVNDLEKLNKIVNDGIADPNLMTFYEHIPSKFIIHNYHSLLASITKILKSSIRDNKIIIYYSGHGMKDCMIMPDRSLLSFIAFRNSILNSITPYVELFCILDCCNPNGLNLPYKLKGNSFMLSSEIKTKISCVTQPILLLTSSEPDEKSIATKTGSIFSKHLFQLLTHLACGSSDDFKYIVSSPKGDDISDESTSHSVGHLLRGDVIPSQPDVVGTGTISSGCGKNILLFLSIEIEI